VEGVLVLEQLVDEREVGGRGRVDAALPATGAVERALGAADGRARAIARFFERSPRSGSSQMIGRLRIGVRNEGFLRCAWNGKVSSYSASPRTRSLPSSSFSIST